MARLGALAAAVAVVSTGALASCLGPLVDDTVPPSVVLLPADAEVPFASGALAERIAELDAVGAVVPLRAGFAGGEPAAFWDFGPSPNVAVPIWVIVRDDPDGTMTLGTRRVAPVGQGNVIDAVPGDPGYSPYWRVFLVAVTDLWDGEQVTSAAAIDAGVTAGLLEAPVSTPLVVNCPVVDAGVRLERDFGAPLEAPDVGFYRGVRVAYFSFAVTQLVDGAVAAPPVYALRREGGEPLDETLRGVDMTGDGDVVDSNDVFAVPHGGVGYSDLVERVEVVVRADYRSIDSFGDDGQADVMDAAGLVMANGQFDPTVVVAVYPSGELRNRPQRPRGARGERGAGDARGDR